MNDWKSRLQRKLEPHLTSADPRAEISAYHNMPYAIFHYPPTDEFELRKEIRNLTNRLELRGKQVTHISLADCLSEALAAENFTIDRIARAEAAHGTETMLDTIHYLISEKKPLVNLIVAKVPVDAEPTRDVIFLMRAGALYPFYRTSSLLEQLAGKINVPAILFYPGNLDGVTGLRFMGVLEADHNYRPKIF